MAFANAYIYRLVDTTDEGEDGASHLNETDVIKHIKKKLIENNANTFYNFSLAAMDGDHVDFMDVFMM